MTLERLPPYSEEAEQGLLGCVLLDANEVLPKCELAIDASAFYDLRHRVVYEASVAMWDARNEVSVMSIRQRLSDAGKLKEVGGVEYLTSLPDATGSAASADYFLGVMVEKWEIRRMIKACSTAITQSYEPDCNVSEILDGLDSGLSQIVAQLGRGGEIRSMAELTRAAIDSFQAQFDGADGGLMTGFDTLDELTQGLKPGELFIVAARPSIGKTSLVMNIASNVASQGVPVGAFSMEMSDVSLVKRMLAGKASLNAKRVKKWGDSGFSRAISAASWTTKLPIFIDSTPGLSVVAMRARARSMKRNHDVKLIAIDYLQLISSETKRGENREREVAQASNMVKNLARELEIPIILLCQLNRDLEKNANRKPRMSDLRESGAIEQDADIVGILYRPPSQDEDKDGTTPIPVDLLICKNRDGERGEVELTLFREFTRFETRSKIEPNA